MFHMMHIAGFWCLAYAASGSKISVWLITLLLAFAIGYTLASIGNKWKHDKIQESINDAIEASYSWEVNERTKVQQLLREVADQVRKHFFGKHQ